MTEAYKVFHQQNGDVTRAYYAKLSATGTIGEIAVALFRCQKRSSRAKQYRRGKWRAAAYDVKEWSMGELCRLLTAHAESFGFRWGWKEDPSVQFDNGASQVLYVDIPGQGQVSFHSPSRLKGPDYLGEWDGLNGSSEQRIISFCAALEPSNISEKVA